MFIEGKGLTHPVALDGGIKQVRVNLQYAGFGVGITDVQAPQIWFGHANAHARYDAAQRVLEITERVQGVSVNGRHPPLLWLDLPYAYLEQSIDSVDVRAKGLVSLDRITAGEVTVETWGDLELKGLYIGRTCFAKTVRGNAMVSKLTAPQDADPRFAPTAEIIALQGAASVTDSVAAWRISAPEINAGGASEPQHLLVLPQIAHVATG